MKRFCVIGMVLLVICLAARPASAPQNVEKFRSDCESYLYSPRPSTDRRHAGTTSEGIGVLLDSMYLIGTVGYPILDSQFCGN